MELSKINNVYFLGIGGIGMSALARYFNAMGKKVSGYDKTPTKLTNELIAEGIDIHFEDDTNLISNNFKSQDADLKAQILIVYTPAVPSDHKELNFFRGNNFVIKKRAEVLGMITEASYTIGVAGTHGKTTTSSLIAHVLKTANLDPSAFLGGITQNYSTNLLLSSNLKNSESQTQNSGLVVVEADEYDRSFLTLHPEISVITSVDADHLDIYGDKRYVEESYSLFARQVKSKLVLKKSIVDTIVSETPAITYSVSDTAANYFAQNIRIENAAYQYEVVTPAGVFKNMTLGLPGLHNVENSIAAVAVACLMDIEESVIREALRTFRGVKRRFDYQIKTEELVFIDDYAHHPEELKACINSAKQMYPGKKITGIFQPHLFSRTRDFADEFAASLDLLDECILLEIYPARELPIEGVNSKMLLDKMKSANKRICQKKDLLEEVGKSNPSVLLTMGAGDIDTMVGPLKNELMKSFQKK
ncbi:MAG: UDP-N-acetylmuramate--L-alanine ligase [Bacteroidota bacterium]